MDADIVLESSVNRTPTTEKGGLCANAFIYFLFQQPYTKALARLYLLQRSISNYKKATVDDSVQIWQAGKGVSNIHAVEPVADILKRFGSVANFKQI